MTAHDRSATDPDLARRNRILGLILAGFVILVAIGFMISFRLKGLPPDKNLHERDRQRASGERDPNLRSGERGESEGANRK